MNKFYLFLILGILFLPLIVGEQQSLGTFKQNECINLIQTCSNCSVINITSIVAPNSLQVLGQSAMTKSDSIYNKTFCGTSQIGQYIVNGLANPDNTIVVWNYNFEITPSGSGATLGFYILLIIILGGVITLGFAIKEGWFVVIGGMGLMILGIYSILNGVAGFKDGFMTWAISVFLLGVGAYLAIKSAIELVEEINLG